MSAAAGCPDKRWYAPSMRLRGREVGSRVFLLDVTLLNFFLDVSPTVIYKVVGSGAPPLGEYPSPNHSVTFLCTPKGYPSPNQAVTFSCTLAQNQTVTILKTITA